MNTDSECSEALTVTFEWTLRGLKNLFNSTKGDKKSKVTKSLRFGNGKWQILFYANAGQQKEGSEGGFISLFLSCEPTAEEREAALAGRWVREGVYRFTFELRNLSKTLPYNSREANNHTFTYKTANWGWPQFARRDSVYYQSMLVLAQDAFVVVCTIHPSPTALKPQAWTPRHLIPKTLLDTVGSLLDDPSYSDVEFIIAKRRHDRSNVRAIYACKKMLRRTDYFETMFTSSFAENAMGTTDIEMTPKTKARSLSSPPTQTSIMEEFEDSDDEDEESFMLSSADDTLIESRSGPQKFSLDEGTTIFSADSDNVDDEGRLSAPESSGTSVDVPLHGALPQHAASEDSISSSKTRIQVRDVAYTTYRAMLYYIYTDTIIFAPLSSSFQTSSVETRSSKLIESTLSPQSEGCELPGIGNLMIDNTRSRAEWIRNWLATNPGRVAPCSAKSIYRLADRLDLTDLKERSAQHIIKSLTVDNIAYEVFSPFAATYDAIRKIEVEFFLKHWNEIRSSDAMKNIWVQIRNGRHPGFEQVWPLIAQSLEFQPTRSTTENTNANNLG